ncbi:MAG TPA: Sir2 family NAD-dependent protein deacetylase [Mycobacteriales bacterium]|nr:Sir2 family NAD-dependent protein deacetylase [Mycobacteriales bacterium]
MGAIEQVAGWVAEAERITVMTGAGISTDSGIPDFRGPNGVWTRNPAAERLSTYQDYVRDPAVRRDAWARRVEHPGWDAQPNAGHRALADLERSGKLVALITQNIDELHQRAGSSPDLVHELHGTMWHAECVECGWRRPMAELLDRVRAGEADPPCADCGGIVKSATISFGQQLDPDVVDRSAAAATNCDLFLAIGSSLTVHPAAGLCGLAVDAGARLVVINAQPTPYDDIAAAVIREPISKVLPALVASLHPAYLPNHEGSAHLR